MNQAKTGLIFIVNILHYHKIKVIQTISQKEMDIYAILGLIYILFSLFVTLWSLRRQHLTLVVDGSQACNKVTSRSMMLGMSKLITCLFWALLEALGQARTHSPCIGCILWLNKVQKMISLRRTNCFTSIYESYYLHIWGVSRDGWVQVH